MLKYCTLLFFIALLAVSCRRNQATEETVSTDQDQEVSAPVDPLIVCTDSACAGTYEGPEFINGDDDVAHQFSNAMSGEVGDHLKDLYNRKKYSKVDFEGIEMRTKGIGTGTVTYYLKIPFERVPSACEAFTSFDHCGGWDHPPELEERKKQLRSALLKGDRLNISRIIRTPEGLEEYWIQWRNKDLQKNCAH